MVLGHRDVGRLGRLGRLGARPRGALPVAAAALGSAPGIRASPFYEGSSRGLTWVYRIPFYRQKVHEDLYNCLHFSMCARHPCAGAMLIFSVSFQV